MREKVSSGVRKRGRCNREEVLQLAMQEFREMEYEEIQMNVLASKLGVSNGTMFYHFPTKQTLFYEIYIRCFLESIEDNLWELKDCDQMSPENLKDYLLKTTENMFDNHFDMVRLIKIHSMVLDKGVNMNKVKPCLEEAMQAYGDYIETLLKKNSYMNEQEIIKIINARSAITIGYYYMFMEPKIIDSVWTAEKKKAQRIVFKHKVLETLSLYLDGVMAKYV